jgi:hypothetical protein
MSRYNVYNGDFVCQVCGISVPTMRSYPSEKRLTWMCKEKHLSEINLNVKKSKRDYE